MPFDRTAKSNPFDPNSPEWQLFENARSSELSSSAFTRDAHAAYERASAARQRADDYWSALSVLVDSDMRRKGQV